MTKHTISLLWLLAISELFVKLALDARYLVLHGSAINAFDESGYINFGRMLWLGQVPGPAWSPGLAGFYSILYIPFSHDMFWLFSVAVIGHLLAYVAIWLGIVLVAVRLRGLSPAIVMLASFMLLPNFPLAVVSNSSDAFFTALSGMAFAQILSYIQSPAASPSAYRALLFASVLIGFGATVRNDGYVLEALCLVIVALIQAQHSSITNARAAISELAALIWPFWVLVFFVFLAKGLATHHIWSRLLGGSAETNLGLQIGIVCFTLLFLIAVWFLLKRLPRQEASSDASLPGSSRPAVRWLVVMICLLAIGAVLLSSAMRDRSYFAFQQGEASNWSSVTNAGPFPLTSVTDARYGSAEQNHYSVLRAIRRSPGAFARRLQHEFTVMPSMFEDAFGIASVPLIILWVCALALIFPKDKATFLLGLLWPVTNLVYLLTFIRSHYFFLPIIGVLAIIAIGIGGAIEEFVSARSVDKITAPEPRAGATVLKPQILVAVFVALVCVSGLSCLATWLRAKPDPAGMQQYLWERPVVLTLSQSLPEGSKIASFNLQPCFMARLSVVDIDPGETPATLENKPAQGLLLDPELASSNPAVYQSLRTYLLVSKSTVGGRSFKLIYKDSTGNTLIGVR